MELVLSKSRWLRFGGFSAFYFAQGVPLGLVTAAIPAWLAEKDVSQADVAIYTAWVSLPWALKLIAGPFMDRFTFLPMGFRRPWVIALQSSLVLSLLALALVGASIGENIEGSSLTLLTITCAVVNTFSATQDVAVDGMAVDLLPEDERGRANAFMGFGQKAASSMFGAVCGTLLALGGIAAGALACAVAVALVLALSSLLRERPSDRFMPWSSPSPHEVSQRSTTKVKFVSNLVDIVRVLFLPMSLVAIAVEFVARLRDGMVLAVFPVTATQRLGFTAEQYNWFDGGVGFLAAALIVAAGPFIDRFGAKRVLMIGLLLNAALHLSAGAIPSIWDDTTIVLTLFCAVTLMVQLVFVAMIAMFMNLCVSKVAATQFAVYMALANLARSVGGGVLAYVDDWLDFHQEFLVMGGLLLISAGLLMLLNESTHARHLAAFEASDDRERAVRWWQRAAQWWERLWVRWRWR